MKNKNNSNSKINQSKEKELARIYFKEIRKASLLETENLIFERVKEYIISLEKKEVLEKIIGIYWPLDGEVDLRNLKKTLRSKLALPACNVSGEISYHKWTDDTLEKDFFGIPAPLSQPPLEANEISLIIAPAIAIDQMGTRLGYGRGCFDRLRSKRRWKAIKSLAIVPSKCISNSLLPKDKWDIPFDGWINEKEIFQFHDLDNQ